MQPAGYLSKSNRTGLKMTNLAILPQTTTARTMPHNLAAEVAVLGSTLFDGRIPDACEALESSHFFSEAYGQLWTAIKEVSARGMAVTPDAVSEAFSGALVPDLLAMLDAACMGHELRTSVKVVMDTWHRRRMITAADELRQAALGDGNGYVEPNDVLALADDTLDCVRKEMTGGFAHHDLTTAGTEALDGRLSKQARRIPTGFVELDERLGGLEQGTVTILAARTSMGKSALAICLALNAVRSDATVGYFSLEMSRESLAVRGGAYLLHEANASRNLHYTHIANGKASPEEETRMRRVFEDTAYQRLLIDDRPGLSVERMSERFRAWEAECRRRGLPRPSMVVIDHMGNADPGRKRRDRFEEVSVVSKAILAFAKRHDVAVLALCQLNRNSDKEERRPQIHDLRQSGEIEEDAHAVLMLWREEYYAKRAMDAASDHETYQQAANRWMDCRGRAEVIIVKNRNGPLDTINLRCEVAANAFYDIHNNVQPIWGRAGGDA